MADIRYVIVSDLHFGAENSVLTTLNERPATAQETGFSVDPERSSPALSGLVDGLRELTRAQDRPPTLILAGDVLDLALSVDEVCSTVYRLFANLVFSDGSPVFDPVIHYVPGNHDHHQWEVARESQYMDYVAGLSGTAELTAPWHTTTLRSSAERPEASSALLTALTRSQPGGSAATVQVSYPNLALQSASGRRSLVVSHGHFTESIYSLMSRLRDTLYPDQRRQTPTDIAVLEGENFAWIDFFWSTLGRSGQVGSDMAMIYADLTSPTDIDVLVANLVAGMLGQKGASFLHRPEEAVLNEVFKREANKIARSERATPTTALTETGQAGLAGYLQGPVRNQLQQEWGYVPDDLTFVYGHTHKPFTSRLSLAGFPGQVDVINTGGWVVDTATPAPVQAGVAVLVNDDLDTASLQFYRQSLGSQPVPVQLLDPPPGVPPSAWHTELAARIDPAATAWTSRAESVAAVVAQRHRLQAATVAVRESRRSSPTAATP